MKAYTFREVAHHFIGCKVSYRKPAEVYGQLIGVEDDAGITQHEVDGRKVWSLKDLKPILLKPQQIRKEEMHQVALLACGYGGAYGVNMKAGEFVNVPGAATAITLDTAIGPYFLCTLYFDGTVTVKDVSAGMERPVERPAMALPEIFHYLTSVGFDLFNLIGIGKAIDAVTLTPVENVEGAAS
jgi:hypothetical protein